MNRLTEMQGVDGMLSKLSQQAGDHRAAMVAGEDAIQTRARLLAGLRHQVEGFESLLEALEPRLIERVECDGYTRERVELGVIAGLPFSAYVLIPHALRQAQGAGAAQEAGAVQGAGVIATHGHGWGSRQVTGMLPDGSPDPDWSDGHKHFAVQLVRKGLVVIAPDVIGFGERRSAGDLAYEPDSGTSCYRLATTLMMHGRTLTGLRVTELLGVAAYLRSRPEVDERRIGIAGFSGGAQLSMITAALDEEIAAALLIGFPNTFDASILSVHHCACNYLPGLLDQAELPDLMGLVAPRPLFIESGQNDPIFPAAGFRTAVDQLTRTYRAAGVPDRFESDLFPGQHEVSGRRSFDWLTSTLMR